MFLPNFASATRASPCEYLTPVHVHTDVSGARLRRSLTWLTVFSLTGTMPDGLSGAAVLTAGNGRIRGPRGATHVHVVVRFSCGCPSPRRPVFLILGGALRRSFALGPKVGEFPLAEEAVQLVTVFGAWTAQVFRAHSRLVPLRNAVENALHEDTELCVSPVVMISEYAHDDASAWGPE